MTISLYICNVVVRLILCASRHAFFSNPLHEEPAPLMWRSISLCIRTSFDNLEVNQLITFSLVLPIIIWLGVTLLWDCLINVLCFLQKMIRLQPSTAIRSLLIISVRSSRTWISRCSYLETEAHLWISLRSFFLVEKLLRCVDTYINTGPLLSRSTDWKRALVPSTNPCSGLSGRKYVYLHQQGSKVDESQKKNCWRCWRSDTNGKC